MKTAATLIAFFLMGCSGGGLLIVETQDAGTGETSCPPPTPEDGCDDCEPCTDDAWCELCDAIPPVTASKWCHSMTNFPTWCNGKPVACQHNGYTTEEGTTDSCFPVENDAGPVRPLHTGKCCAGVCVENDAKCQRGG